MKDKLKKEIQVEGIEDWIETILDAEAHGKWVDAPNFATLEVVAGILAPQVKRYLDHTIDRVREEERERIKEYIKGEMEQDESALTCECDGSGSGLDGYCNCGFTRQRTLNDILQSLTPNNK